MKPEELRIGNLVKDSLGNILKVIWIDLSSVQTVGYISQVGEWNKCTMHSLKAVFPVDFNKEWAERFDFENTFSNNPKWFRKKWEGGSMDIYIDDLTIELNMGGDSILIQPCKKSVNQIQNLFYTLTNQELQILQTA